jgi:hypothetical protein
MKKKNEEISETSHPPRFEECVKRRMNANQDFGIIF